MNDGRHAEAGNQRTTSRSSSCRPSRRFPRHSLLHREVTDMEGPAVKRVVTPPAISRSMLTCEDSLRMDGRFPEGAGARLTSGRLRRRIRLICAGYPRGQSRMTPLRRELPLSKGARHPDPKTGRRIVSARTLQSCLLPVAADATRETEHHGLSVTSLPMRSGADSRVPSSPPR